VSTKKKISDIDKAIEEMQQRRDECFKHIGKAMYESCPELGDMRVGCRAIRCRIKASERPWL